MKILSTLLFLVLFISNGFTQNFNFEYLGRKKPAVKKTTLENATVVGEIMPALWDNIGLAYKERVELDLILNYFPDESYNKIIDIHEVEIEVMINGERKSSIGNSEMLTAEQKELLKQADMGSSIAVRFRFFHRYTVSNSGRKDIRYGYYSVDVVPETEASYPGGNQALSAYLKSNVVDKIFYSDNDYEKLPINVDFIVTENGDVENVDISRKMAIPDVDQLIKNAFTNMAKWTPAVNAEGVFVRQKFSIPFGGMGC